MWFKPATALLKQQIKRGELTIFILAIALAVTSVFSLSGFGERLNQALVAKGSNFLAADRVLSSAHAIDESILNRAQEYQIKAAEYLSFNSMVFHGDEMLLAFTKAVKGPYPLRGELKVSDKPLIDVPLDTQGTVRVGPPPQGQMWASPELLVRFNAKIGDKVDVGDTTLTIGGIVTNEPDGSFSIFNSSPTIFINDLDVAATKIVQPGSRVYYNYLYSGEDDQLSAFYQKIKPDLKTNQNWQDIKGENSPLASSLERANQFLLLSSLLGIILAATAISVTASRFSQHQLDTVALLKTLGTNDSTIRKIFVYQLTTLAVIGITLGLLVGFILQEAAFALVQHYLPQSLPAELPGLGFNPLLIALSTGGICAALFSLTPMLRLFSVPVMRVIKRDMDSAPLGLWKNGLVFGGAIFLLLLTYSQDIKLSLITLTIAAVIALVLSSMAWVIIRLSRGKQFSAASPFKLAMASLYQRANQASMQIASIATAIMLMLIVLLLRNELIDEWQSQIPEGTANHFLGNVTPDQVDEIDALMKQYDVETSDLYPIIRGRVSKINDDFVGGYDSEGNIDDERKRSGRRGFGRELSLTWRDKKPDGNPITQGQWWDETDTDLQVSIEADAAERLEISIGDKLTTLIGEEQVVATVTSVRDVHWRSMRPNFMLIFNRPALGEMPSTYISSFYVNKDQHPVLKELLTNYPTISLIKIDRLIKQLREIIEQVSLALSYIMFLVVCAAILVLLVQIQASYQQRHQDLVILRTLGAGKKLLQRSIAIEFLISGALAGFIAALTTELALWLIQTHVIEMPWKPHPTLWLLATAVGSVFVAVIGTRACKPLTKLPPNELIRNLS
ncbi:MAG: ABC transporter permease [Psychrobium sp.]